MSNVSLQQRYLQCASCKILYMLTSHRLQPRISRSCGLIAIRKVVGLSTKTRLSHRIGLLSSPDDASHGSDNAKYCAPILTAISILTTTSTVSFATVRMGVAKKTRKFGQVGLSQLRSIKSLITQHLHFRLTPAFISTGEATHRPE